MRAFWWCRPILVSVAAVVGLSPCWTPAPHPPDAADETFSAGRAFAHVEATARKPHPSGSIENLSVREHLAAQFRQLGLTVTVQDGVERGVRLGNVYAELPGTNGMAPPVLLVAHYDSVPAGPGAADDMAGVAALLETARAMKAGGRLRNSLAFLVTDGEERGLLGAKLFVREHPELWQDVRVVVNLEARGNRGPVLMFETGAGNRGLVKAFGRVCANPLGTSVSQDVYRRLPNDTDFTVFLRAGKRGYNLSFYWGLEYYHTARDTPVNLSQRSLQHEGDTVLALAQYLGRADAAVWEELGRDEDSVYFTIWRGLLLEYPIGWVPAVTGLVGAAYLGLLAAGTIRRQMRMGWVLRAALTPLAAIAGAGVLGWGAVALARQAVHLRSRGLFLVGVPHADVIMVGLILVVALGTAWLQGRCWGGMRSSERLAGALLGWLALSVVAWRHLPGASYLFHGPAVAGAAALALALPIGDGERGIRAGLVCGLLAIPGPLLFAPTLVMFYQGMTLGLAPGLLALTALVVALVWSGRPRPASPRRAVPQIRA
ncbi:MAG TPA: M20/M25/M40 family metallo-hydrolase [Verrucomicrobiota bacterium]|nr:M20/M25/M40 family metallo-hydrolase [Verrucomicrobiota bacterium]HNU52999.1 M20/M25/M40 family metallo-hydrolase [Verrucomicrobiota bacterium]